jgi:hypothetical protein
MSNRVHVARARTKRHCGHQMTTWRNTRWDYERKKRVPVQHYVCTHCGHQETENR